MKTSNILFIGLSLALLGAGCGSTSRSSPASTRLGEAGQPATSEAPAKPPARNVQLNEVALPSDFPSDVPRYAGTKVINALSNIGDGSSLLSLTSSDEASLVLSWYDSEFVRAGFTRTQDVMQGTVTSREYAKAGLKMVLTVDNRSGTTNPASLISVRRTPKSN